MNLPLDISKEQVGAFIGGGGSNLKKCVIGRTKREYEGEDKTVFCNVEVDETQDPPVFANLRAANGELLEKLKENVLRHQDAIIKKGERPERRYSTKFVFKTDMDHHMISKFIGARGKNIKALQENVALSDSNLQSVKEESDRTFSTVKINISEDKKIRMQRLRFEHVTTSVKSEQKVLITVEMNTSDREASFAIAKDLIIQTVEEGNTRNFSNQAWAEEDVSDHGEGADPEDGDAPEDGDGTEEDDEVLDEGVGGSE